MGPPITPKITPHPGFRDASEIDLWGINTKWGVLSTPCIDLDAKVLYAVAWTSTNGRVANSQYELHAFDITDGRNIKNLRIEAAAPAQANPGEPAAKFIPSMQKQRASLLLAQPVVNGAARKMLFIPFGLTHEENDPNHGWLIAVDQRADAAHDDAQLVHHRLQVRGRLRHCAIMAPAALSPIALPWFRSVSNYVLTTYVLAT